MIIDFPHSMNVVVVDVGVGVLVAVVVGIAVAVAVVEEVAAAAAVVAVLVELAIDVFHFFSQHWLKPPHSLLFHQLKCPTSLK